MQQSPKTRLRAVCPITGSELLPPASPWNGLEVRNATLLYGIEIDKMYEYEDANDNQ